MLKTTISTLSLMLFTSLPAQAMHPFRKYTPSFEFYRELECNFDEFSFTHSDDTSFEVTKVGKKKAIGWYMGVPVTILILYMVLIGDNAQATELPEENLESDQPTLAINVASSNESQPVNEKTNAKILGLTILLFGLFLNKFVEQD